MIRRAVTGSAGNSKLISPGSPAKGTATGSKCIVTPGGPTRTDSMKNRVTKNRPNTLSNGWTMADARLVPILVILQAHTNCIVFRHPVPNKPACEANNLFFHLTDQHIPCYRQPGL